MTRKSVIKKIVEILEPWESSKLDKNCADEIFTALEDLGIIYFPRKVKINGVVFTEYITTGFKNSRKKK